MIPKKVIEVLNEWNTCEDLAQDRKYDQRTINALLLVCVSAEDLAKHIVGDDVKNLLKGMYKKCQDFEIAQKWEKSVLNNVIESE